MPDGKISQGGTTALINDKNITSAPYKRAPPIPVAVRTASCADAGYAAGD